MARGSFKRWLGDVIFEHDTPASRGFDVALLILILLSVLVVMLESVVPIRARYGNPLNTLEWGLTVLFTAEYALRVWTARERLKYVFSFFGLVDLLAILPSYLSLVFVGSQYFIIIRSLRLLRTFRILKLAQFTGEASVLMSALRASRVKITVFMMTVVTLVTIIGAIMYLVEGPDNGFANIPLSVYWAIVTLTTVGYGDIAPKTALGQFLSAVVMILGYAIIAVPTGIVTSELSRAEQGRRVCPYCGHSRHDHDARFCKLCSGELA